MEGVLVSAATGALKPVLWKLATLLGDEYKRFKAVHGEIKFLIDELAAMEAFLLMMSDEEDPNEQDKVWMAAVRELSYDMEDTIDDFIQHVDNKDTKPDGFMEKIKHSLGKLGKIKARRRIGDEIEDLKKQIIEVGERNERYKTCQAHTNNKNVNIDPRALAIFEHASKLVGTDEPKAELIKLLMEDDGCASNKKQLKLVSIAGSGGMGKTTLAHQVYQDLKGKFQCRAFVSVSRNPDIVNILRIILSKVSNQRYADTEEGSVQQLIINITDFLQYKRYLIVVDDIWDVKTWDVIKYSFPRTNIGSRIITTTRMRDVADSCRSSFDGHIYNIRPLRSVHSRQLFHGRLFNSPENCPSYLEKVSQQILEKCHGLPLAIIAVAGLLANKERTEDLWNQVKDSIGRALERNASVQLMMKILSLSYFDLPPHLKTCFLYLGIFPEDFVIEKKGLIRRWIAEGFIHTEGRTLAYEFGEKCFNELVNRSLIQLVDVGKYDKVKGCRVHDIILDFILSKSIEENFVTIDGVPDVTIGTQSKVRRLSLQVSKQGNFVLPTSQVLSHVRSLSVFGDSVGIPCLDVFVHLRVLDFGGCTVLENHHFAYIGRLFQLRHLNLRRTKVSKLPEQIGNLRHLEILDLRATEVRELPASIVNLINLVHLLVDREVKFPCGIKKMQALETLKSVSMFKQPFNFMQELGQLKNLRKLVLEFVGDFETTGCTLGVKNYKKVIISSLDNLGTQNLRSLTIWGETSFLFLGSQNISSERPCPIPLSMQKLKTYGSAFLQVPHWVDFLVNLQQLRLAVARVLQRDVPTLGLLPVLLILDLQTAKPNNTRLRFSGVGFRCLRKFGYYIADEAMNLFFAEGAMPKLENLEIWFDAFKTESLGTSGAYDFGIENLTSLVTVRCQIFGQDSIAKASLERAANTHPNRPTLLFR